MGMSKSALITGITGQDGSYLAELLLSKGYKVYGLVRRLSTPNYTRIAHILPDITLLPGDLLDTPSLIGALYDSMPDEIYNLAAQSHVGESFRQPFLTWQVNATGPLNLLEAVRHTGIYPRIYQASTSELYGKTSTGVQSELTPFYPRSPYAVAKQASYWNMINYRERYSMFTCNGILFNHESPRRGEDFVTRKITRAVARIAMGLQSYIELGDIDVARDWGFAGDYVSAMWLMLQQSKPRDYVVATGEPHTVKEFLQKAFLRIGVQDWMNYIAFDPGMERRTDVYYLAGDASLARKELGWTPTVHFDELVNMMVDADIEQVKANYAQEVRKEAVARG